MPDNSWTVDAARFYLSGASHDGGEQISPDRALGGFRSRTEVRQLGVQQGNAWRNIEIELVRGAGGPGTGTLYAVNKDTLRWMAANRFQGNYASLSVDGGTYEIAGSADDYGIRLRRTSDADLRGVNTLTLTYPWNGVIGMTNVEDDERQSGSYRYRAIILKASNLLHDIRVWCNGNVAVGLEAGGGAGEIQTIADDQAAPDGVDFSIPLTAQAGVTAASVENGATLGIWIRRPSGAGRSAALSVLNQVHVTYGVFQPQLSGVEPETWVFHEHTQTLSGLYRVADTSLERYLIWLQEGSYPDLSDVPTLEAETLPARIVVAPPANGLKQIFTVTRRRNRYGLVSQNVRERALWINALGNEQTVLHEPEAVTVVDQGGGMVRVRAKYYRYKDEPNRADTWDIYTTTDHADPVPGIDTPVSIEMFTRGAETHLERMCGPYQYGTDFRVLVRARRASDNVSSINTTATRHTCRSQRPGPAGHPTAFHAGGAASHPDNNPAIRLGGFLVRCDGEPVFAIDTTGRVVCTRGQEWGATEVFFAAYPAATVTRTVPAGGYVNFPGDIGTVARLSASGYLFSRNGVQSPTEPQGWDEFGTFTDIVDITTGQCVEWVHAVSGARLMLVDYTGDVGAWGFEANASYFEFSETGGQ